MKQPELGKKLSELRKARGLTQEELVERCNVSVRTIQRIETGDVTPRSYTVRTIVTALDYTFEEIFADSIQPDREPSDNAHANIGQTAQTNTAQTDSALKDNPASGERWSEETGGVQSNKNAQVIPALTGKLTVALVFGFIYFLLTFPEAIADYFRFSDGQIVFGRAGYTTLKIAVALSFVVFQWGYILIGKVLDYYLMRIAAIIHIVITVALCLYDAGSIYNSEDTAFMIFTGAVLYGAIGLVFGYSLMKLRKALGSIVMLAGGLEIISAVLFLTVVLIPLADVVSMFAELLELIIIFKVIDLTRSRENFQSGNAMS